jgi:hypothetical protein
MQCLTVSNQVKRQLVEFDSNLAQFDDGCTGQMKIKINYAALRVDSIIGSYDSKEPLRDRYFLNIHSWGVVLWAPGEFC